MYNSQLMNLNINVGRNVISYEYKVSVRNGDRSELMHHQTSRPMSGRHSSELEDMITMLLEGYVLSRGIAAWQYLGREHKKPYEHVRSSNEATYESGLM